jgi:hypothetical protein
MAERAGDPALADAGGADDEQVLVPFDLIAGDELLNQRLVEPARRLHEERRDDVGTSNPRPLLRAWPLPASSSGPTVHSAQRRCALGMCSGIVVPWRLLLAEGRMMGNQVGDKNEIKFASGALKYYFLLMSKLARLVEVASDVLRVPEKTVRSRVMLLRKNSLWSSIGKGISADPAPSDASNLLLSFLGGGLVTETAETVSLLRDCLYIASSKGAALPPISVFAELGNKHTLGDMLDALFAQWSEHGPPVSVDSNRPFTSITLAIERYSHGWAIEFLFRCDANLPTSQWGTSATTTHIDKSTILRGEFDVIECRPTHENRGEERWLVEYESFLNLRSTSSQGQLARAARRMAEKRGDLVTSARVSERTFTVLAECLSRSTVETRGVVHPSKPLEQPDKLVN